MHDRGKGAKFPRCLCVHKGFIEAPRDRQVGGVPVVRRGIAAIEFKCRLELLLRAFPVPVKTELDHRERQMCFCVRVVDTQSF